MDPYVTCKTCGARRNCMEHMSAEFPPEAAKRWLRKRCDRDDCDLAYTAGVRVSGPAVGQSR